MTTTGTYIVFNPTPNAIYYAPSGFWVVPNNATNVSCTVNSYNSSGQLITVSSLAAYIHNQSNNSNTNSFSGGGVFSVTATSNSQVNGSNVFTAGGSTGQSGVASIRMYLTYTGHAYDQPPNAPSLISPSGGAVVTDTTPPFVAGFSDPTAGDKLAQYEIQVYNGSNGSGSLVFDTGNVAANSSEISSGQTNYSSGTALTFGHSYSWRVRMANNNGNWGPYSGFANFSVVQGPSTPSNLAPAGLQTTTTPGFSFLYSSPGSVSMQSYHWWITNSQGVTVYDPGSTTHSAASGVTISGTIPGGANLQFGTAYNFNVNVTDTNSATSGTGISPFSVAARPKVTPTSPINNEVSGSNTPTFNWNFSDANSYAQQSFRIEIFNASTNALIKDTGTVASAATSYTLSGASISFGTNIRWIIKVVATSGIDSGFSSSQYASVNNAPTATITNPTNLSTITTATPNITWTYTASGGGQPQASAQIILMDANSNVIATYNQSGTGTSFALPAGVIQNTFTYKLQVAVTDTGSNTGTSAVITFTLLFTPPADMQGQSLTNAENYLPNPYLNTDGGAGRPTGWTGFQTTDTYVAAIEIDPTVVQPVPLANGDGFVTGAHQLGVPSSSALGFVQITSHIDVLPNTGWTIGSTALSFFAYVMVQALNGTPQARLNITYQNSSFTTIRTDSGSVLTDTSGAIVKLLGPQNSVIPALTAHVYLELEFISNTHNDLGYAWFMDAQVEAATASDANFIAGDIGTGYSFDTNGFSIRTQINGASPNVFSDPGADTDPVGSSGGTNIFSWDTSLADARFFQYIVERRKQADAGDDDAWVQITTISNSLQGSYTDYTAGNNIVYQYAVRQQITYTDGSFGVSAHRAVASGGVLFTPAWYLTNTDVSVYNMRFTTVSITRKMSWHETATYTPMLGRTGQIKDAGPPLGYAIDLVAYFDDSWGDVRPQVRKQLVTMQQLNVIWTFKDPSGFIVPVYIQDIEFDETDTWSDTLMTVTLHLIQAQATVDT